MNILLGYCRADATCLFSLNGMEEAMNFTNEQVEQLARAAYVGDPIFSECGPETLTRQPQQTLITAWNAVPEEDRATFRRVVRSTLAALDHRG